MKVFIGYYLQMLSLKSNIVLACHAQAHEKTQNYITKKNNLINKHDHFLYQLSLLTF